MMQHMNYLVFIEKRPFSYHDFLSFEINEKEYTRKHGTFRNKVSQLIKAGIDLESFSTLAFYNIKGVNFGKIKSTPIMKTMMMTPGHTEVLQCPCNCNHPNENGLHDTITTRPTPPIYKIIETHPSDKKSLHDIYMRFEVPNIYTILLSSLDTAISQEQHLQIKFVNKGHIFMYLEY